MGADECSSCGPACSANRRTFATWAGFDEAEEDNGVGNANQPLPSPAPPTPKRRRRHKNFPTKPIHLLRVLGEDQAGVSRRKEERNVRSTLGGTARRGRRRRPSTRQRKLARAGGGGATGNQGDPSPARHTLDHPIPTGYTDGTRRQRYRLCAPRQPTPGSSLARRPIHAPTRQARPLHPDSTRRAGDGRKAVEPRASCSSGGANGFLRISLGGRRGFEGSLNEETLWWGSTAGSSLG